MNLTSKFIFIILFITSIVVSTFTYIQIQEQQKILKNELKQRINLIQNNININAKYIINTLKYDVENDIASFNFSHIDILFEKLLKNKQIKAINMSNKSNDINLFKGDVKFKHAIKNKNVKNLSIRKINNGYNFIISTPINFTTQWGTLNIIYSLDNLRIAVKEENESIKRKIKESIKKVILTSFILAIFIIIFTYTLARKLLSPILLLTKITKKITNGENIDSTEFNNIKINDEIGTLYETFKEMSIKLEGSYKKLQLLNENLEQKVEKRTKQLHHEKQKAESATKIKSEFLANMSHEIRTPMNGILGMLYLTQQTSLSYKQKEYISKIEHSAKSLMTIINDILDLSKLEATKLTLSKVNFNLFELIQNILDILEIEVNKKNIKLIHDYKIENSHCYGDSLRITQILTNILGNAVKFTEEGSISITTSKSSNNTFRFEIKDTGIGLTKQEINKLFQSFSQADSSTTRKYGGTGLGLVISKQLVELMNGTIWVESQKNLGSTFYIEIEIQNIVSKNEKIVSLPLNESICFHHIPPSKILLVEDNQINQEIIMGLLEDSPIDIDIANNGEEAISLFNANIHKIILMDIKMPIMGGIEATTILRKENQTTPILALTANVMKEDIIKSKEIGMNEHLEKPINLKKLLYIFEKYLLKNIETKIENLHFINSTLGLKYMNNNKSLYLKVLKDFYNKYKDLNFQEENNEQKELIIHTLKGLSLNLGAEKLYKSIINLESIENTNLLNEIQLQLNNIIRELKNVETENKNNKKSNLQFVGQQKEKLFEDLEEVINQKKPKQCHAIIKEIEKYKLNSNDNKNFDEIKEKISKYDFKQAAIILKKLQ